MADRPRLNVVDDPVSLAQPPTPARTTSPPPSTQPQHDHAETRVSAHEVPAPAARTDGYRQEQKRAVFGRVPRSLHRRLERAVVELRDDIDDLTQEQVLAALLAAHVDPSDPAQLQQLSDTVRAYRQRL